MKFDLRRIRKSHGFNCLHRTIGYTLKDGANSMIKKCVDCGYELGVMGWDDVPAEAREVLLASLAEDKDDEKD